MERLGKCFSTNYSGGPLSCSHTSSAASRIRRATIAAFDLLWLRAISCGCATWKMATARSGASSPPARLCVAGAHAARPRRGAERARGARGTAPERRGKRVRRRAARGARVDGPRRRCARARRRAPTTPQRTSRKPIARIGACRRATTGVDGALQAVQVWGVQRATRAWPKWATANPRAVLASCGSSAEDLQPDGQLLGDARGDVGDVELQPHERVGRRRLQGEVRARGGGVQGAHRRLGRRAQRERARRDRHDRDDARAEGRRGESGPKKEAEFANCRRRLSVYAQFQGRSSRRPPGRAGAPPAAFFESRSRRLQRGVNSPPPPPRAGRWLQSSRRRRRARRRQRGGQRRVAPAGRGGGPRVRVLRPRARARGRRGADGGPNEEALRLAHVDSGGSLAHLGRAQRRQSAAAEQAAAERAALRDEREIEQLRAEFFAERASAGPRA